MKQSFLTKLRCPKSGQTLHLELPESKAGEVESGWIVSEDGLHRYPIIANVPRFVPEANYADSFGMQWNHFRQTQLDSYSGHPISADRFWKATGWTPEAIRGKWVLDAGCGAGRFAEIALRAGANVVALDYSSAVEACYCNLQHYPNLHVVQGDIYALPFEPESFQFVYSLGVLQHTPDVAMAFAALPKAVSSSSGKLCVDYYKKSWKSVFHFKYWLRPLTRRVPKPVLFSCLRAIVPVMLSISKILGSIPVFGRALKRLIPVVNYYGVLPLTQTQHQEWALLDTFDWLAPRYDQPQTPTTALNWMRTANMHDIEVLDAGHLVARGHK